MRILASCTGLAASALPASALQLALVNRDVGHAMLFRHQGNCYALLPSHVAEQDRFSLELPLQRVVGAGTAFLRDDASDLAVAFVEGDITGYCVDPWSGFAGKLDDLLKQATRGEIVRLSPEGVQDRTEAQIFVVTPEMLVVRTSDALADGRIFQGNSGSVLEVDGRVVGIAQAAISGREARFFRIDRAADMLGPQLGGGLAGAHPGTAAIRPEAGQGPGFRVTGWSGGSGSGNAAGLESGLLANAFVAPWTGEPIQIEITLDNSAPVALNAVKLFSNPAAAADQSPPKTIQFELDAGTPEQPFWRVAGQRDMPPSGLFDFQTGGVFARRVRITFQSIWFGDRPNLRVDGLSVE